MPQPPARFVRVHAELLPAAVTIRGITYGVSPINPSGPWPSWTAADLLAALNVARAHLFMGKRLLELTKGLPPGDFCKLLQDQKKQTGPDQWSSTCSEAGILAAEITCQNGAEVITSLFDQLTAANESGQPVTFGPVSEPNAHAAAFAVAHQIANEVLSGSRLSIKALDLDRLEKLLDLEAGLAADMRKNGARIGPAVRSEPGPHGWSVPTSPADWYPVFRVCWKTMLRRFQEGKIKYQRLSSKRYRIAIDDIPETHRAKFLPPK